MTCDGAALDEEKAVRPGRRRYKIVVSVLVLAGFVLVGRRYFGELHRLVNVSFWPVVAMVVSFQATHVVNGRILQVLLRKLDHSVGLGESFLLSVMISYTNLFVPRAGMGTPAVYLKYKHDVGFADYGALLMPVIVLHVLSIGVVGLTSLAVLQWTSGEPFNVHIAFLFACAGICGFGALFLRVSIPDRYQGRIGRFLRRLMAAWKELGSSRSTIAYVLALRTALLFLRVIRLYLAFSAIGEDTPFLGVLIATMLGDLAMLVSVTPGGLGFREAALVYSATILGCSAQIALAAAVLDRLLMTFCTILLAQIGIWKLIRPVRRV